MPNYRVMDGINIQWPWSEYLVSGQKVIETRSYPLPERLRGVELAIIETPGPRGKREAGIKKARIIGTIVFKDSYQYKSKRQWMGDHPLHLVKPDDKLYRFVAGTKKFAWTVGQVKRIVAPVAPPAKRGIIIAKDCKVPKV